MSEKRDEPEPIRVSVEVTSDGRFLFVFPEQASYAGKARFTERVTQHELEFLVRTAATYLGWQSGPDLRFNENKLPTRAMLEHIIDRGWQDSPLKDEPGARRAYVALETFRAYAPWLPDQHRVRYENDIKFLERRFEELYMYRRFFREIRSFRSMVMSPASVAQIWQAITTFTRSVFESVGIDLWNEKDDHMP